MSFILPSLGLIAGIAVIIWSADRFVEGAAGVARLLGVSALLIGMLVVGFGTSAPEMAVSLLASLQGSGGLALGNAFGSNIANIGLILGCTALIAPIAVSRNLLTKEIPILLAITLLAAWFLRDNALTRFEGIALLVIFALSLAHSIYKESRASQTAADFSGDDEKSAAQTMSAKAAVFWLIAGLVLLVGGSQLLVRSAVKIAEMLGVSDLIIGLTIVAVGTSLPELASSIAAIRKGHDDIALGNVVGSNFFNTLCVVGIAAATSPLSEIPPEVIARDIPVTFALTLFLLGTAVPCRGRPARVMRWEGGLLLAAYAGYVFCLVKEALI